MNEAILIPVKAFHRAKVRLRGHIPDPDRGELARWLAAGVLAAAGELPTFVACDDPTVAEWAEHHGARVLWTPELGLNGAVDRGVAEVAAAGYDHVTICHGDVALPERLPLVARADTVVLVPDTDRDGTNVLSRPVDVPIAASYGAGSFGKHLAQALEVAGRVSVRRDDQLALDIDTIEDYRHPLVADRLTAVLGHSGRGDA